MILEMAIKKTAALCLLFIVISILILLLYNQNNVPQYPSILSQSLSESLSKHLDEHKHVNVNISEHESFELLDVLESNELAYFLSETIQQPRHPGSLSAPKSVWQSDFCRTFIGDTFHQSIKICEVEWWDLKSLLNDSHVLRSRKELIARMFSAVTCYRTSGDAEMATCVVDGLVLNSRTVAKAMTECKECYIPWHGAVWLLNDRAIEAELTCFNDGLKKLESCTENNDFVRPYIDRLIRSAKNPSSNAKKCDNFVMGRTHMFMLVDPHNVYFNTLALYDVFKSILDYSGGSLSHLNDTVLRVSTSAYTTIDLDTERKLFPNFKTLSEYSGNACFQQAVLVPRAYSAVPFRCKTDMATRRKCQDCDGKNLESSFILFKRQVLKACNLDDVEDKANSGKKLVFVSRKPYNRFSGDQHSKFQRILTNSDDLIRVLKETFPNTDINVVHLEEYSFCEQVKLAHNADVYMGVHGAGLVHLWWMRSEAVIIELEPAFMRTNPTFATLAKLVGQRYHSVQVKGTETKVSVSVSEVINKVKTVSSLK